MSAPMKVDKDATKAARTRHNKGLLALTLLYGKHATEFLRGADMSGKWLTRLDRPTRRMIRRAKDKQNPSRVTARARRKQQRASRRSNR